MARRRVSWLRLAAIVRMAYPDSARDPTYEPVGESRQWLARRTGLH